MLRAAGSLLFASSASCACCSVRPICTGRNGDQLFDDIHAWVNVDGFLGPCKVGVPSSLGSGGGSMNSRVALLSGGGRTPKQFDAATITKVVTFPFLASRVLPSQWIE